MRSPKASRRMKANVETSTNVVKKRLRMIAKPSDSSLIDIEAMTPLVKRLDEVRKKFGWSWRQFSIECGLHPQHMPTIKDRGNMTVETLERIRQRTKVNLNWLVCGVEDMGIHLTADQQAESVERRIRRRPLPTDPPSKPPSR
jgi:hypothetical protein